MIERKAGDRGSSAPLPPVRRREAVGQRRRMAKRCSADSTRTSTAGQQYQQC